MDRNDSYDAMSRMFEQLRRSMRQATAGSPMTDGGARPLGLPAGGALDVTGGSQIGVDPLGIADMLGIAGTRVRMETTDDAVVAVADVPGFETDEITVRFNEGALHIEALHEVSEDDETSVRHTSRRLSETVHVPAEVDEDEITASYRNGVLEVHMPTVAPVVDEGRVIDIE